MEKHRYPIGRFNFEQKINSSEIQKLIDEIEQTPQLLSIAVEGLTDEQLDTPYREGGWTVKQLVHHVADSHLHAYIRTKFILAETTPEVKPYDENVWAAFNDGDSTPIEVSLALLAQLHIRWTNLLRGIERKDFDRTYTHPENSGMQTLLNMIAHYAWHGRHHIAQISNLRKRNCW